ncbi:MAG: type IV pilin protein [Acidiferrobacterales bacterium]
MKYARSYGFTLVELMITVVVLAIIVGIAYPGYHTYMIQTRRSDAQIALMQVANLEEKFFSACPQVGYTNALSTGSIPGCDGLGLADDLSLENHYRLTIDTTAALCGGTANTCFRITADPDHASTTGQQKGNGALRIDNTGLREWDKDNNNSFTYKWSDK